MPATSTLEELAAAIISAFEFDFDHLYKFTYPNRFGTTREVTHPYMDESPATTEVEIGDLALQPGTSMEFVYDFGDWWTFRVTLEKVGPPDPTVRKPVLLEKHGEAPPQYPIWEDEEDWEE